MVVIIVFAVVFVLFHHSYAVSLNESAMNDCLGNNQYQIWTKALETPSCKSFIHVVEQWNEQKETLQPPQQSTPAYDAKVLRYIAHMFQLDGSIDRQCKYFEHEIIPCVHSLEFLFQNFLQDEMCQSSNMFAPTFNRTHIWQLALNMYNSICATSFTKRCSTVFFESLGTPDTLVETLASVLNTLHHCDELLGCCGGYIEQVASAMDLLHWELIGDRFYGLHFALDVLKSSTCRGNIFQNCTGLAYAASTDTNESLLLDHEPFDDQKLIALPQKSFSDYEPQQIHLALDSPIDHNASTAMSIMWLTKRPALSFVQYGTDPDRLNYTINSTMNNYTESLQDIKILGQKVPVTYIYTAPLFDLTYSTRYYYQCITGSNVSQIFSFETAPNPHASIVETTTVAIYGDMGLFESRDVVDLLVSKHNETDIYLHIGDIAYADNWYIHNLASFGYESVWNDFLNAIQPLASTKPYMVSVGNHETECHDPFTCLGNTVIESSLGNYTAYNQRFRMPKNGAKNMWYSYDYGLVHFISISTESDFKGSPKNEFTTVKAGDFGDQYAWLRQDLEKAQKNRKICPWIVIVGHRPIYSIDPLKRNGNDPIYEPKSLQEWLEPLMVEFQVDLYFSGHVHSYERHGAIYQGKVHITNDSTVDYYHEPEYPVHIVNGAGGNEELHHLYPNLSLPEWNIVHDEAHFGIGYLKIYNHTHLRWSFEAKNGIVDQALIKRKDRF